MLRSKLKTGGCALTLVPISTPAGVFGAHFSEDGLAALDFPGKARPDSGTTSATSFAAKIFEWSALTKAALESVLSGAPLGELPPLDVKAGTGFQRRVWSALRRIPAGQTKSYSEIAAEIGSRKAARAVGRACGANPIPLLIPCHRVLACGGKLGGFSGGLHWKKRLLRVEGGLDGKAKQSLLFP